MSFPQSTMVFKAHEASEPDSLGQQRCRRCGRLLNDLGYLPAPPGTEIAVSDTGSVRMILHAGHAYTGCTPPPSPPASASTPSSAPRPPARAPWGTPDGRRPEGK